MKALYSIKYNCYWVLKIRTIYHARDLWKLAQSYKQLHLLCPPGTEIYQVLPYSVDFKAPGSFEIHWVRQRQYLVNAVLFGIKYL